MNLESGPRTEPDSELLFAHVAHSRDDTERRCSTVQRHQYNILRPFKMTRCGFDECIVIQMDSRLQEDKVFSGTGWT